MKPKAQVVIVGSGFGGSVMAMRLAMAGVSVRLLERGRAYPPGTFPRTPRGFSDNFWDPSAGLHGLFNVWSFDDFEAVVASGLGGGSLIYSSVCLPKDPDWFYRYTPKGTREPWPITYAELAPHYEAVLAVLQPELYPVPSAKTVAVADAAAKLGLSCERAHLAVKFRKSPGDTRNAEPIPEEVVSVHGPVARRTCRLCGECNLGCNDGSKNTLDFTYLARAQQAGATIEANREVMSIARDADANFTVTYRCHDQPAEAPGERTSRPKIETVTATHVVLAAGALGSPYLLLRSKDELNLTNRNLGTRFSGNGDYLAFVTGVKDASCAPRALDASQSPVITSVIKVPDAADVPEGGRRGERGLYVEDAGYPEWIAWIAEGLSVRSLSWRGIKFLAQRLLRKLTGHPDSDLGGELHKLIGNARVSSGTMPLLAMGLDTPDGEMALETARDGRSYLQIKWRDAGGQAHYERARATVKRLARAMGGKFLEPPFAAKFNRAMTVHPLGGCPMGTDSDDGFVSAVDGEVFGAPRLYVADGSVMPGPVGANPSLTIAAVADKFATAIIGQIKVDYDTGPEGPVS